MHSDLMSRPSLVALPRYSYSFVDNKSCELGLAAAYASFSLFVLECFEYLCTDCNPMAQPMSLYAAMTFSFLFCNRSLLSVSLV